MSAGDSLRNDERFRQLSLELSLAVERWRTRAQELTGATLVDAQLYSAMTEAIKDIDARSAARDGVVDFVTERARRHGAGAASLAGLSHQHEQRQRDTSHVVTVGSVTASEPWPGCIDQIAEKLADRDGGVPVLREEVSRMAVERGLEALVAELGLVLIVDTDRR